MSKIYPSVFKMISNFSKELGTLKRNVMRCTTCGCKLEQKAKWKTADCPENKWKSQNEKK